MNYQNGKIYQILCLETGERYIGSCTTTLTKRMYNHKLKSNRCASKQIIDRGHFEITLIDDYPCERKEQLIAHERYYYDKLENINRPMILEKDKEAIKKEMTEYQKVYKLGNEEKIAEHGKKYRLENKEKIVEYKKKYRLENEEKIAEHGKKYRLENKEKIAEYRRKRRALSSKVKIDS